MLLYALAFMVAGAGAGTEQWVLNAGFEQAINDRPLRWELFVQPMDGAYGRLSDEAYAGEYAAMLHIPEPYPSDPINNWNQTIFGDFGGRTIEVTGYIKIEGATDASLWLQCWQQPAQLLHVGSSASTTPMYGTEPWREVRFQVDVPELTDYLVLRCVLQGQGSAWFDEIAFAVSPEEAVEEEPEDEPAEETVPPVEEAAPTDAGAAVLEAAEALRETVDQLRESNEALRERFEAIAEELSEVRAELSALKSEEAPVVAVPQEPEAPVVETPVSPPTVLMPHGTAARAGKE
jgi:hypothetical protein